MINNSAFKSYNDTTMDTTMAHNKTTLQSPSHQKVSATLLPNQKIIFEKAFVKRDLTKTGEKLIKQSRSIHNRTRVQTSPRE